MTTTDDVSEVGRNVPAMTTTTEIHCPPWCVEHSLGDLGCDDHYGPKFSTSLGEFGLQHYVDLRTGQTWEHIYFGDLELTATQAREVAMRLTEMANMLDGGRKTIRERVTAGFRQVMASRSLTIADVARHAGVPASTLRYRINVGCVHWEELFALASLADMELEDVVRSMEAHQ